MPNITTAQVQKINKRLHNGWTFDLWHFMTHSGEKTVCKEIALDDTHFIKASLYFSETYKNFRRDGLEITLHMARFTDTGNGMASSSGLGLFRRIPYEKARRSFADLEKLTEVIDDAYIMGIYNSGNNADKCLDDIILDKSGWHIHEV
jgi:hypothetical protein